MGLKALHVLMSRSHEEGIVIVPTLHLGRLRYKEVK